MAQNSDRPAWPAWYGFAALALTLIVVAIADVLLIALLSAFGIGYDSDSPGLNLALTLAQDAALVGTSIALASRTATPRPEQFGVRWVSWRRALKWAGIAVAIYLTFQLVYVNAVHVHEKQTTLKELGSGRSWFLTALIGVFVVGVAPFVEEFFFRGFLFGSLRTRLSWLPAALIGGLVFGAVHASTGVQAVPPLAALGFALCLCYEATGSILPGVCLHALNNMVAFGSDKQGDWAVGAVVACLVLVACVTLPRRSRTLT